MIYVYKEFNNTPEVRVSVEALMAERQQLNKVKGADSSYLTQKGEFALSQGRKLTEMVHGADFMSELNKKFEIC